MTISCGATREIIGSKGQAFRSGRPAPEDIIDARTKYGINSVICLLGDDPRNAAICQELGIYYRALGWGAWNNDHAQLDRLRKAFQELPQPYLIHCKAGVDRTGCASAYYRVVILGHDPEDADNELRFFFNGHVPFFGTEAMDELFATYPNREPIVPPTIEILGPPKTEPNTDESSDSG